MLMPVRQHKRTHAAAAHRGAGGPYFLSSFVSHLWQHQAGRACSGPTTSSRIRHALLLNPPSALMTPCTACCHADGVSAHSGQHGAERLCNGAVLGSSGCSPSASPHWRQQSCHKLLSHSPCMHACWHGLWSLKPTAWPDPMDVQAEALDGKKTVLNTLIEAAPDAELPDVKALLGRMMFSGTAMEKKVCTCGHTISQLPSCH